MEPKINEIAKVVTKVIGVTDWAFDEVKSRIANDLLIAAEHPDLKNRFDHLQCVVNQSDPPATDREISQAWHDLRYFLDQRRDEIAA